MIGEDAFFRRSAGRYLESVLTPAFGQRQAVCSPRAGAEGTEGRKGRGEKMREDGVLDKSEYGKYFDRGCYYRVSIL